MTPMGFRPVDVAPGTRLALLERAALRFPVVHRVAALLMHRLPAGRLRRLYLERLVLPLSFGALNRGDLEALGRIYFGEDVRMRFAGDSIPGFEHEYVGREAVLSAYRTWLDEWGVMERIPTAYAEREDLIIILVRQRGRGSASGLQIDDEVGQVYRLRRGLAVEYIEYRSWAEAIAHGG